MPNATASAAIATAMTEAQLLDNVIDAAQKLGWRVAHFRPAKTSQGWRTAVQGDGKGFPDLVCANDVMGEAFFAECKSQRGTLDPEQEMWRDVLLAAGQRWYLFRPSDWLDGAIFKVLEGVE